MAVTQNTYTGNGATVLYSFTFPYLETTDVKVTINGTPTTAYTFANATTIQFNTAPANGAAIRIYRDTDDASLAATFYSGSAIRAQDLNDNFTQNLYVTQEINNNSLNIDGSNPMVGNLNMNGFQIDNLAAPTSDTDAVNRAYVNSVVANGIGDGDKGDIVVSGSGTTFTIDSGAITNSKVSASAGIVSSKLAFTQTGTGAVQRTVESKLQEVVSVKDFGAIGNGVTNDTTAFVAAFAALNTGSNPKALFIPAGNYVVNHSTCLITASNRTVYGEGPSSRLIFTSMASGGYGIGAVGTSDTVHISNVLISDLAVVASGWTGDQASLGIYCNRADQCSVQRCMVLGDSSGISWLQGIFFGDTNNSLIANNIVRRIAGNGISLDLILGSETTSGNLVTGNTISITTDSGIGFHNNVRYSAAVGNTIDRPGQVGGTGIDIAGCNSCLFANNTISNSGQFGIRLLQNLSYRTVDNVVIGNTVYHPSTAGAYPAIALNDTERNTITNNTLIGNSNSFSDRAIYIAYTTTGSQPHPVTGETLFKLRGSVIKDNDIKRFTYGIILDAPGGITGATLTIDKNCISDCTNGLTFNTATNEQRFTIYGHNQYLNCTTNVSSNTAGIARNGDILRETLSVIPVNVSTPQLETTVSTALITRLPSKNTELIAQHRLSEVGAFDGIIRYKTSAGTTIASGSFGGITNSIGELTIPLVSADLLTVTIEKTGSPATGTVDCTGLAFEYRTYY